MPELATGDCFMTALNILTGVGNTEATRKALKDIEALDPKPDKVCMIHALVAQPGTGLRHTHTWIETRQIAKAGVVKWGLWTVWDYSNGRYVQLPREVYYALGYVEHKDSRQYRKYFRAKALDCMLDFENWGPWHIKDDIDREVSG